MTTIAEVTPIEHSENGDDEITPSSPAPSTQKTPSLSESNDQEDLAPPETTEPALSREDEGTSKEISSVPGFSPSAQASALGEKLSSDHIVLEATGNDAGLAVAAPNGVAIENRLRAHASIALTFAIAIILSVFTIAFASTSFPRDVIFTPPFLPYSPQYAILVLQLLAAVSLMAIRVCFAMCSEVLRWSLASRGTNLLTFLVLSNAVGFSDIISILFAKPTGVFATWRMFACYKLVILDLAMLFGQFVWLLEINARTTYQIIQQSSITVVVPPSFGFYLEGGVPNSYSALLALNFLLQGINVYEVPDGSCSSENDIECAMYICPPAVRDGSNLSSNLQITYRVPTIITQFQSNTALPLAFDDPLDPWAYCTDHTSSSELYLRFCVGGEPRTSSENSSVINAGWQSCDSICDGEQCICNNFTTTMSIETATATVISWLSNFTIADITDLEEQTPYSVNISQFFNAFSAPLMGIPLTYSEAYDEPLYANQSNATFVADSFVDGLHSVLGDTENYNEYAGNLLRVFLTFALNNNQIWGVPYSYQNFDIAIQANALSISPISSIGFTVVTALMLVCCVVMWTMYPGTRVPNISTYPEIMFGAKLNTHMMRLLNGLGNGTNRIIIERLAKVTIKVGAEQFDGGGQRITISTAEVEPLKKGVEYI